MVEQVICNHQVARSNRVVGSRKGGVPEWLKGTDCKSVARGASEVQILPPPP